MQDNVEATIAGKSALASIMQQQVGSSRFALGDIGNIGTKVSNLTIDPGKKPAGGIAVKKEILSQQLPVNRQKTLTRKATLSTANNAALAPIISSSLSTISTTVKATVLKHDICLDLKVSL